MTEEDIVQKEDNFQESENNQPNENKIEYFTGDDKKEVNNENSDSSSQDDDSNTEEVTSLSLKNDSELFVMSVDGVPSFYTKTIDEARNNMWAYAKLTRIHETQYNTYIRGCSDKNRLEIVGSNKFSVFTVDRVICRLLVSVVQELEITKEQKTLEETNLPSTPPTTPTTPPVAESSPKRGFFSSFFW
jgi:hypothetical protein